LGQASQDRARESFVLHRRPTEFGDGLKKKASEKNIHFADPLRSVSPRLIVRVKKPFVELAKRAPPSPFDAPSSRAKRGTASSVILKRSAVL